MVMITPPSVHQEGRSSGMAVVIGGETQEVVKVESLRCITGGEGRRTVGGELCKNRPECIKASAVSTKNVEVGERPVHLSTPAAG